VGIKAELDQRLAPQYTNPLCQRSELSGAGDVPERSACLIKPPAAPAGWL